MIEKIKRWARRLKLDVSAVFIAAKDQRTPRIAKYLAIAVVAYALSPIDLIPDFIPVLGYLDDLIIVPAGIAMFVKMIPDTLMACYRKEAELLAKPRANWTAGIIIAMCWIGLTVALYRYAIQYDKFW